MEHIQLVSFSPCQRNLKNLGSISDCNDHKNGIDFYMRLVKWPQIAVKKKQNKKNRRKTYQKMVCNIKKCDPTLIFFNEKNWKDSHNI